MGRWQQNAASLKGFLADKLVCTWEHTARQFCEALGINANTPPAARAEGLREPASASTHRPEIISVKTETTVPGRSASTLIQSPHLAWPDVLKEDVPDRFLLLPASGVVPFHRHRDGLLPRHLDWVLAEDQPIKLWLLAGPGGEWDNPLADRSLSAIAQRAWLASGFLTVCCQPYPGTAGLITESITKGIQPPCKQGCPRSSQACAASPRHRWQKRFHQPSLLCWIAIPRPSYPACRSMSLDSREAEDTHASDQGSTHPCAPGWKGTG